MVKKFLSRLFFTIAITAATLSANTSQAQTPAVFDDPGGETGGDGNGSFGDGPVVPLSSNLSVLLLTCGIAYGMKKVKE